MGGSTREQSKQFFNVLEQSKRGKNCWFTGGKLENDQNGSFFKIFNKLGKFLKCFRTVREW